MNYKQAVSRQQALSWLPGREKAVQLAPEHPVIELAALVRPAAEVGFKGLVRRDDVVAGLPLGEDLPHYPGDRGGRLFVQQPFTIRGVGDDNRPFRRLEPADILRCNRLMYAGTFLAMVLFCGLPLVLSLTL